MLLAALVTAVPEIGAQSRFSDRVVQASAVYASRRNPCARALRDGGDSARQKGVAAALVVMAALGRHRLLHGNALQSRRASTAIAGVVQPVHLSRNPLVRRREAVEHEVGLQSSVLLVDAPSVLCPKYYALDKYGRGFKAADAFMAHLKELCDDRRPDYLGVAFDPASRDTWRHKIYPSYKGNRKESPKELRKQLDCAQELCKQEGFHQMVDEENEADDVLATWSDMGSASGRVTIISEDKDLQQLITPNVEVEQLERQRVVGVELVKTLWGVRPEQLGDLLALVGDAADNVKGVPGIGKKTAALLLNRYLDLDGVLQAAQDAAGIAEVAGIGPKRMQALQDHAEDARFARELVSLRRIEHITNAGLAKLGRRN